MTNLSIIKNFVKEQIMNTIPEQSVSKPLLTQWIDSLCAEKSFKDQQLLICLSIDIKCGAIDPYTIFEIFEKTDFSKLERHFSQILIDKPYKYFGSLLERHSKNILKKHNNSVSYHESNEYFQIMNFSIYKAISSYLLPIDENFVDDFQYNSLEFLKPNLDKDSKSNEYLKPFIGKYLRVLGDELISDSKNISWVTDAIQMTDYLSSGLCDEPSTMTDKLFDYFALPVPSTLNLNSQNVSIPYVGLKFEKTEKLVFCQPCTFHASWANDLPIYFISYSKKIDLWGRSFNYVKYPTYKYNYMRDAKERVFEKYITEMSDHESPIITIYDVGNLTHTSQMNLNHYLEEGLNRFNSI